MPDLLGWLVLGAGAVVASTVGGVAGFGDGIIMLPLMAWVVGVRSAVPVLTVTMLVGNLSRIWWSRGEIDRAVVLRFALGAMPATVVPPWLTTLSKVTVVEPTCSETLEPTGVLTKSNVQVSSKDG